jgi:hypothetical protein
MLKDFAFVSSLSLSLSNSSTLHDTEVPEAVVFLGGGAGRRIRVCDGLIHPHPFANVSDLNLGLVFKLFFVWIFLLFLFSLKKKKINACKENIIVIIMLLLLEQSSQKNKKSCKELTGVPGEIFCQHQEENRESSNIA